MARGFNGSSQSASVVQDLSSVNKLTVCFWLWVNAFDNGDELACEYTANGGTTNGGFYIDPNSAAVSGKFEIETRTSASFFARSSFTRPSAAAWHHYVILMDNSIANPNIPTVYVDGLSVSLTINASATGPINFANDTMFLMARNNASLRLAGRMADFAIYGGYLMGAGEASALGTGAARPYQVGQAATLFRWWPMDGLASPEPNLAGAGINLSLTGTPPFIDGPPFTPLTPRWPQQPAVSIPAVFVLWARSVM